MLNMTTINVKIGIMGYNWIFLYLKIIREKILSAPYEGKGDIKSIEKNIIFPLKELYFDDVLVYVPNDYEKYCIDAWGSFPPNELPFEKQYPHEGRISFVIPTWMLKKNIQTYIQRILNGKKIWNKREF